MRRAQLFIYLFIYLFTAIVYLFFAGLLLLPLLLFFGSLSCFLFFHGFKQALHNKPPTHPGGNYSRIVFQPRFYSHNMAFGTAYNY